MMKSTCNTSRMFAVIIFAFIFITCSILYAGTKERINNFVLEIIYDNDIAGHLEPCR